MTPDTVPNDDQDRITDSAARRCWNCNVAIPDTWDDVLCADCEADEHA